ncbi:hypothetical protein [Paraburkholderia sp. JHI869]|uniref:hypothetical protein n=1 Tax=Paraburkholderia sp. JHI869 TaxID=3112959 RepID=UPI0031759B58
MFSGNTNKPVGSGAKMKKPNGEHLRVGHTVSNLIDQEIAHIRHAISISLSGRLTGPAFPASYWRKRLHSLFDSGRVNISQLGEIDSLLLMLDLAELNHATTACSLEAKEDDGEMDGA